MDVFVYGTLTEPDRVKEVLDSFAFVGAATLAGLRVVEGRYPTLVPPVDADGRDAAGDTAGGALASGADAAVGGRLLRTDDVAALDAYERVDDGLYTRVSVPLFDADGGRRGEAAVYIGDPARLDALAAWPGDGSFAERVERGVRERGVAVSEQPER